MVYYSVGFNSESFTKFLVFWIILFLLQLSALGKGMIASGLFDNVEGQFAFAPALFVPNFLFAGLLINNDNYPDYIFWFKYISDT